jgi:CheY-like chemotaxis protein
MTSTDLAILAVDDDLEDLELMQDSFAGLNPAIKFNKLTNASEVLPYLDKLADTQLPCLIILDYNMPQLNGAQVIAQLRKTPRYEPIPKVVLSTSNASTHIRDCMQNGAAKYFVKPPSLKELARVAQEMLSYSKCYNSNPAGR